MTEVAQTQNPGIKSARSDQLPCTGHTPWYPITLNAFWNNSLHQGTCVPVTQSSVLTNINHHKSFHHYHFLQHVELLALLEHH